jgi:hypothetical protein
VGGDLAGVTTAPAGAYNRLEEAAMRAFWLGLAGGATGALLVVVPALVFVMHRDAPAAPAIAPVGGQGPLLAGTAPPAPTINPTVLAGYQQQQGLQAARTATSSALSCQRLRELYEAKGVPYRPQPTAELTLVELEQLYGYNPNAGQTQMGDFVMKYWRDAAYGCLGR